MITNNPKCDGPLTQETLDKLKVKAKYYGHYAEFLRVVDLINEIESLRVAIEVLQNHDGE